MIPDHGNLLHDIPAHLAAEQFDLLLQTGTCRLERIISIGHITPPGEWYDQENNEWVLLSRILYHQMMRWQGKKITVIKIR